MADLILIPETKHGAEWEDWYTKGKPAWARVQDSEGHPLKPIIRCNCGQWSGIGLHHVHADGTVTASYYHKKGTNYSVGESPDGCEWHVFLKLEGYNCGDFPPRSGE